MKKLFVRNNWIYLGIVLVVTVSVISLLPHKTQQHFKLAPPFKLDSRIATLGNELGIPQSELVKLKAQVRTSTACGADATVLACTEVYTNGSYVLTVAPQAFSTPGSDVSASLAHEYLHYIWGTHSDEQAGLSPILNQLYQSNPKLKQRMNTYIAHGFTVGTPTFTNELHSIVGTEMADNELPSQLLAWYKQWLPNRSVLPSYF